MSGPRIVLVGTGSMGSLHARVLAQSDRCELVRVVDPREDAGRTVAERFGVEHATLEMECHGHSAEDHEPLHPGGGRSRR